MTAQFWRICAITTTKSETSIRLWTISINRYKNCYTHQKKQDLQQDLNKSNQAIVALKGELSDQVHRNKELVNEVAVGDKKLQFYKAQDANTKVLHDQIAQLHKDIAEAAKVRQFIEGELQDVKKELGNTRAQLQTQEKNNAEKLNSLRQKLVDGENRINQLQNDNDALQKDNTKVHHTETILIATRWVKRSSERSEIVQGSLELGGRREEQECPTVEIEQGGSTAWEGVICKFQGSQCTSNTVTPHPI